MKLEPISQQRREGKRVNEYGLLTPGPKRYQTTLQKVQSRLEMKICGL